jgi:hypothetical protein
MASLDEWRQRRWQVVVDGRRFGRSRVLHVVIAECLDARPARASTISFGVYYTGLWVYQRVLRACLCAQRLRML